MVLTKVPMIKDSTSEKVFDKFLMAEIMVNIPPLDRNVPLRVKIYLPVEGPYQLDHLLACDEIGPQCLSESTHVRLGNSWPPQLLYHHARCKLTSVFT